ncbi:MAG: carbohydrate ABC transporter permease [Defluviitaleaceae bacterium]|nr:carbohydrate ABC transporter permease [Defluviitaleaceae bacterium]
MGKILNIKDWMNSPRYKNNVQKWTGKTKNFVMGLFIAIILAGVCYIIIAPVLGLISTAFMSVEDIGNPVVFLIPAAPSLYNISHAFGYMDYVATLIRTLIYSLGLAVLHVVVCSFVGYGFARFKFRGSEFLFALVIVSIVIPIHAYMIPMVQGFRFFLGNPDWNLINDTIPWPIILLTATGVGVRSGLYIFIFRQFFRGIPKEIEEAAFVDGASPLGTYLRIMLPNAVPAVITVFLFSFVWQYNDVYYAGNLFVGNRLMANMMSSAGFMYSATQQITNPMMVQMITFGAVVLTIAPILIIYLFLQRFFVEGLERSGIVG